MTLNRDRTQKGWAAGGFSCDLRTDPPGQIWENFIQVSFSTGSFPPHHWFAINNARTGEASAPAKRNGSPANI